MRLRSILFPIALVAFIYAALVALHAPFLRLPYFWDEAGYYIPAALDFYHYALLIPRSTLVTGHTPLVPVYLGTLWHLFGFSALVTRAAMLLTAAATVAAAYAVGREVASREVATWGAGILAISPVFFAQSSLAHLDVTAALFTTLAILALLRGRMGTFAVFASLAILSKETAVVLVPVAGVALWALGRSLGARASRSLSGSTAESACGEHEVVGSTDAKSGWDARAPRKWVPAGWPWLLAPAVVLAAWLIYLHHATGLWGGNHEYLQYNLFSTLNPIRILLTLLRRSYELFIAGFNWVLVVGAAAGMWGTVRGRQKAVGRRQKAEGSTEENWRLPIADCRLEDAPPAHVPPPAAECRLPTLLFWLLAAALLAAYLLMLSLVGGAVLPRYLAPALPVYYLALVVLIWRLPKPWARAILILAAACLVSAWFINPPGPFPYEDNLSYTDFIELHQQAASFLEKQPGQPRILTAWPASDELVQPFLGYVSRRLTVVPMDRFEPADFARVRPDSFDLLYLYSRSWEPPHNWLDRSPWLRRLGKHYFDYSTQVPPSALASRLHLRLIQRFDSSGQWVRIYAKSSAP